MQLGKIPGMVLSERNDNCAAIVSWRKLPTRRRNGLAKSQVPFLRDQERRTENAEISSSAVGPNVTCQSLSWMFRFKPGQATIL